MTITDAPVFGCPKCAAPNPRDDQLCVDCMRAKLSYLNALAVGAYPGGGPIQPPPDQQYAEMQVGTPPPIVQQPIVQQPIVYVQGVTGPAANVPPAPAKVKMSPLSLLAKVSPGWYFVIGFVIFFLVSGRGMVSSNFEAPRTRPSVAAEYAGRNDEPEPRHRAAGQFRSERIAPPSGGR